MTNLNTNSAGMTAIEIQEARIRFVAIDILENVMHRKNYTSLTLDKVVRAMTRLVDNEIEQLEKSSKPGSKRFKDLTGNKYGALSVVRFVDQRLGMSYWDTVCEIGHTKLMRIDTLKRGVCIPCKMTKLGKLGNDAKREK